MVSISAKQIKIARTYLGWTQADLAQHADVSPDTVFNLETCKNKPQQANFDKIVSTLQNRGIEFIEGNGIRERHIKIRHYYGVEGLEAFMNDVYIKAREHGGNICIFNSKPDVWLQYLGKEWYDQYCKKMSDLGDRVRIRNIVSENEVKCILDHEEYRYLSEKQLPDKTLYVYGSNLGFLDFSNDRVHITVFEDEGFAESFKIIFDIVWKSEIKAPKGYR